MNNISITDNASLWAMGTQSLTPVEPQNFDEFLDNYFFLSSDATNSGGVAWECLPYQRRLCFLMQWLDTKILAIVKPAQIGYTQLLRGFVGYECAHRGRNTCIWQPVASDAREFSNLQIKSMLRDCPEIAKELRVDYDKKDPDNTTHRRVWNNAVSFFRGATSANEFRRIGVDTAGVDEVDGMDANIEGEGSPDTLAWARMYASARPKLVVGSTPTIEGESNVLRIAGEIEQKFRNYFPCLKCGEYQELLFGGADASFGLRFDKGRNHRATADTARYKCACCGEEFGYENLRDMDMLGELRSKDYRVTNEGKCYCAHTGEEVQPPHEAAVFLNGLVSYTVSWSDGVYQFLKATDNARRGDNSSLISVTNEWLGEGYVPTQNRDLATWEQIKGRVVDDDDFAPAWATHMTQWADVQKDGIHRMLCAWGEGERMRVMRYDIVLGDPATDKTLDYIYEQTQYEYPREDGVLLPISISGIDSGYLTDTVYQACRADPTKIFPTKGLSTYGKPVVEMPNRTNQAGVYICPIGTDTAKDIIAERLKIDIDGPGKIEFSNSFGINDDLFRSCTSNVKKIVHRSGKSVERWTLPAGRNDEGLDCLVGNLALVRLLQYRFSVELGHQQEEEQEADDDMFNQLIKAAKN